MNREIVKTNNWIILVGYLLVAIGLFFGLRTIEIKTSVSVSPQMDIDITDKLIKEKYNDYEMWGYYNGLMMAKRVLGENEWFKEKGFNSYRPNLTCEKVIEELYQTGFDNQKRPD